MFQVVTVSIATLKAVTLALVVTSTQYTTDTSGAAGALDLLAAVFVTAYVYPEHRRSFRSSTFFVLYLFAAALTSVSKSRSFFLRPGLAIRAGLETAAATLSVCLICLEEVSKRSDIADEAVRATLGAEATSGVLSRLLFLFLRPVFRRGYGSELVMPHLSQLDPDFDPTVLFKLLRAQWRARPHGQPKRSRELLKACLKTWKKYILPMVLARLAVTALNFTQPFLLRQIIAMLGRDSDEPHATAKRAGLTAASAFIFFGLPVARTYYGQLITRYTTRVQGGLVALLFHKVHRLPEQEAKKAAAPTLMGADVDGIVSGAPNCLDIPFGVVEIGLGIYVLSGFIHIASLAVLGPVIVFSTMTYFIGQAMGTRFADWNKSIESRIAKTTHILPQLTAIKMLGLGPTVSEYLKNLRVDEVNVSKSYRRLEAVAIIPVALADMMTSVVVIAAALFGSAFQGQMSAAKVFPVLTVVLLIQTPLATVLNAYPTITSMLACFSRIETFLRSPEKKDSRVQLRTASTSDNARRHINRESLVHFRQADIAKKGMKEPLLRGVNFQIPPSSTTLVIGPTGSGKSALVEAILGDAEMLGGSVEVDTSDIGYCGQYIWLRDTTIRDNIIGHEEYDDQRFRRVIRACFLEDDLQWLPGGADYVVGANGRNLSGGQRQRVALVRAAYKASKITVLDDVFSSLDRHTAICILHQLCGRNSIFEQAGCTVILVTYLPQCLDVCSNAIFLNGKGHSIMGPMSANSMLANQVMAVLNEVNTSVRTAVEDK